MCPSGSGVTGQTHTLLPSKIKTEASPPSVGSLPLLLQQKKGTELWNSPSAGQVAPVRGG